MCARCEELEEEVAYLRSELGLVMRQDEIHRLRAAFGIRPQTARLVLAMYRAKGRALNNMQLFEAMPQQGGSHLNDDRGTKLVDVQVCNARRASGADAIFTAFGHGRGLSSAGMARVAAALADQPAQVAA